MKFISYEVFFTKTRAETSPGQRSIRYNTEFYLSQRTYREFFTNYSHKKHHRKNHLRVFSFVMTEYTTQKTLILPSVLRILSLKSEKPQTLGGITGGN